MSNSETLTQLLETHKKLEALKELPDVQEALRLQDEFERLSEELTPQKPTYIPVTYPVYPQPAYPWWQYQQPYVTSKTIDIRYDTNVYACSVLSTFMTTF